MKKKDLEQNSKKKKSITGENSVPETPTISKTKCKGRTVEHIS
jgi:hypothetical protein